MCAGPWRHRFLHTTMNLVLLSFHPAPLVSAAKPSTVVSACTDLQTLQEKWNKKKNCFTSLLGKHFERLFIWNEAHSSRFSVRKTSKVTSYYLLPRLIVANEIPNALIEQVCNLLPNEVVFSHRQTKTKQQRGRYIKGGFGQMGHMLSIESRVHQDHSARSIKLAGCLNTWQ